MTELHVWLGWSVVAAHLVAGSWATAAQWVEGLRSPLLFGFTWAAWSALSVQVMVGALLISSVEEEPPQIHYFYGALCLAAVAIVYSYRPQVERWQYLLYGGGNLFVMGLALRAATLH